MKGITEWSSITLGSYGRNVNKNLKQKPQRIAGF